MYLQLEKKTARRHTSQSVSMKAHWLMFLTERILRRIVVTLREVVVNFINGNTHVLQHLPEVLTLMTEHHGTVMRVVLLDEDVTIEAAHVLNTEDTDRTE